MAAVVAWVGGFAAAALDARPAPRPVDPADCPGSAVTLRGLDADAWQRPASTMAEQRALRARLGAPMPEAPTMVLISSDAAHHIREFFSTVAVRQGDGRWTLDTVGEESGALLRMEPKPLPAEHKTLSGAAARRLDRLLGDRCLDAEPPTQLHAREIGVGAMFHTMEIVTPRRHRVVAWTLRLRGTNGAIADLVIGRE